MSVTAQTDECRTKERLWAAEVSVRFASPYLDEFERRFGREACSAFLEEWDSNLDEIRGDETRWVSIAFLEALCRELTRRTGTDEIIEYCGRLGVSPRYIGAIYPALRLFGSPRFFYSSLPKTSLSVNKVNRVEVESLGRGGAYITYHPGDVKESSKHICMARKAQLAGIPGTWNLPDAQLEEVQCIHEGGKACRYRLRWHERVPAVWSLVGLVLGVLLAFFIPGSLVAQVSSVLVILSCLALGFAVDCYRKRTETSRFAEEQNSGLLQMMESAEQSFQSILDEMAKRQRAEEQAEQLADQLLQSQKLETVGQLAGGIAHDFNNLVTIINSYAEFVDEDLREDDPLKSDLRQIKDAGKRAADLTRQLLAFSRKQVLEPRALDLNDIVTGLEKMLRRLVGEDVELHTVLDRRIGMVNADPGQLEQVLMNLAVNARDAMPMGGMLTIETAEVELDEKNTKSDVDAVGGPHVVLAVVDTGEGMGAEIRDRVFEPFFTTKEKGRGTGLGLSTVYGIVKQSGGNIEVESAPGQGTTFKVFLPLFDAEASHHSLPPKKMSELSGDETILVVEDEPAVRELARRILKSAGYRPIVAADGGEALLECEQHLGVIHLVLTDVIMPKMSGKELVNRLERIAPGLRVLYMSGYTDSAIVHHGVLDAGTELISKPFNAKDLLNRVRAVLDS